MSHVIVIGVKVLTQNSDDKIERKSAEGKKIGNLYIIQQEKTSVKNCSSVKKCIYVANLTLMLLQNFR